jgi:hypothetical protein
VWGERSTDDRVEWLLTAAISIAFAIPLAFAPYMPGGDTPWHAAVVAVLAAPEPGRSLGYFEVDRGFGSYVAVYQLLALLARLVGAAAAVKLLCLATIVGTVWAARSLARAFGGDGAIAILAAPAAYSTTLEFGFLVYLPSVPLTLWSWALVRSAMQRGPTPARAIALAAAWLGVALCHPFAAAVAGAGAALLWLCELSRARAGRAALVAAVLAAGALPAALSLGSVSGSTRPGLADAALWDRITTQLFLPPLESIAHAPLHVIGFVDPAWRYALVGGLFAVAVAWRVTSPVPSRPAPPSLSSRAAGYLFLLLAALYLATPFTFEWPRNWYGAQPRLAPLLWVAGLVALGAGRAGGRTWPRAAALAAAAAALVCLEIGAILPHAAGRARPGRGPGPVGAVGAHARADRAAPGRRPRAARFLPQRERLGGGGAGRLRLPPAVRRTRRAQQRAEHPGPAGRVGAGAPGRADARLPAQLPLGAPRGRLDPVPDPRSRSDRAARLLRRAHG